jgi:transposase-like protein
MKSNCFRYSGYRFPSQIISYAVWAYYRFCLSFRGVEDLLAERGIIVSYETIRQWCEKFGLHYARRLKRREGRLGDQWHLDEVFIRINGQQRYLWRAVDQDGDVIDILVQPHRDQRAAERFFRKPLAWPGFRTTADHYRQIEKLLRCHAKHLQQRDSQCGAVTPTIASKPRISRRANGNGKCADSNLPGTHNVFSPFMMPSEICSEWAVTY